MQTFILDVTVLALFFYILSGGRKREWENWSNRLTAAGREQCIRAYQRRTRRLEAGYERMTAYALEPMTLQRWSDVPIEASLRRIQMVARELKATLGVRRAAE